MRRQTSAIVMTEGMLEWHTHEGFPENLEEVLPNDGNLTETTLSD